MPPLRIIFMGTPDFAVPTLRAILDAGHEVVAVYSQPPRAAGRGMALRKSPVQQAAEEAGLTVLTPERLKSAEEQSRFASFDADVAVVVAYGLILPKPILDAPRHGALNLHASLLPRWRGAAPINRAIMAGDAETGISVMRITGGLDAGPVCLEARVPIGANETAGELHDALAIRGARLMVQGLAALERGELDCRPQAEGGVTYAEKIDPAQTRIDWSRPAREVHNLIRGLSPYPGAWFEVDLNGKRERIKALRSTLAEDSGAPGALFDENLTIACGQGAVRLVEVQRAGKRPMSAEDFLRGAALAPRTVLG
ncbi:MAG TPA: methionyl-tRNA formyltransferase [Methyloceanibacter sp.]|jgi:methionyl-tRNA formyltransferase|nr:methionyl-tRNA formyltransferase [Methyloceanibacter sp.]